MLSGRLQKFGYRKSRYQRVTQRWICGRDPSEPPCRLGPDLKGGCQTRAECQPKNKDGRWHCSRTELAGGR